MKAQTRQVLDLLRLRGCDGLSPAEARGAIACDRLAARIWELRHLHGLDIEDVRERTEIGATFARYYLRERPVFVPVEGTQERLAL